MARIGRVAYLATGSFAVPLLARLPELTDALLVVSAPERPAGRHLHARPSPVVVRARELGLETFTPIRLRSGEALTRLAAFAPDGLLLAAYGQLVPADVLALGDRPPLNVHPSLLPRHRGAAPVAGAILAGDAEAGVSLMVMTAELDRGPIVAQWRVPLDGREEAPALEARLAKLAAERVPEILVRWGDLPRATPQDEGQATVVHALRRDDGWIEWRRDAVEIDRQVRALQPWPGAWTTLDGRRLHVRRAHPVTDVGGPPVGALLPGEEARVACGSGSLVLDLVQPAGRSVMPGVDWRRGLSGDHLLLGAVRP